MRGKILLITLCGWLVSLNSWALLEIPVPEGQEGALPIAVVPFAWVGATRVPPQRLGAVISADLGRSGLFAPLPEQDLPGKPSQVSDVNFADWRRLGTSNLVIGTLRALPDGVYSIEFRLFDVFKGTQVTGYQLRAGESELRVRAHQISDIIYEALLGERGAFNTRIAYITETGRGKKRIYALNVADSDGHNAQIILESPQPVMSPAWSPDGKQLAYVSFEGRRSRIYIQNLATGARREVTAYPGINGAPAWSPDGTRLALTLSKDGNPEIYVLYLGTRVLQRMTNSVAIDTEAEWTPDGNSLLFTSDRGGKPQIYSISVDGGSPQRVTFDRAYNARPRISPDGEQLVMVHGIDGAFRIALLDLKTKAMRILTDTRMDESPSFAPNGRMLLYATIDDRGTGLAAVSADGRVHQRIVASEGVVREPAWSPFGPKR